MSDKVTAVQMVTAMMQATEAAETTDDLPEPGTFAGQYGESAKPDLNGENVEAFLHGTAMINLLIQECILRVATIAGQAVEGADSKIEAAYAVGMKDGSMAIAQLMSVYAEDLVHEMIEGPRFDRAFDGIIANF